MSVRGRYQLLAQRQTRQAAPGQTMGRAFSARLPGWHASCLYGVRGIISSSAVLCAVEVGCWGQM